MESASLGLTRGFVVDSSVLVTAERGKLTTPEVIRKRPAGRRRCTYRHLRPHGGRAWPWHLSHARRGGRFLDELKQHVPIHPISGATAEIIARVGGEQSAKGIGVPFADLIIGCCALELEYAVATHNIRHFRLIPGLDVRQF